MANQEKTVRQRLRTGTIGFSIAAFCGLAGVASAAEWPQWRGVHRDGVWREAGIVERFEGKELKPLWRTPINPGYAGPAVAAGRVYVTDRVADKNLERVHCLDAASGKPIWTREYDCEYKGVSYDAGPRATPTVDGNRVYTVGTMGHLHCLDATNGEIVWKKNYVTDYGAKLPIWGAASAPLVDGRQLIVLVGGKDNAAVIAFEKETGKELWRALSVRDSGYSPPAIHQIGGTRQLIIWHPEAIVSLDPENGRVHWEVPFHTEQGVSIITPVFNDPLLFVSQSWAGPTMLELDQDKPAAKILWQTPRGARVNDEMVNCLMSTPIIRDGHIYAVALYGELRCLDAKTGRRLWGTYAATGKGRWWNAFLIPNEDRVFLANEQGELIIAKLSPAGYEEISRARLIEPTARVADRDMVWSHPAFANRCIYARNDKEILCVSLASEDSKRQARAQ